MELSVYIVVFSLLSVVLSLTTFSVYSNEINLLQRQYERPDFIPFPQDNPYQAEKAALGKMLFFDPRLSEHQNMSCASCHNPSFGWEGAIAGSVGSQNTSLDRHSPTILNMAWGESFFWDGRASTLEEQSLGPIQSEVEMNLPLDTLIERLNKIEGYTSLFNKLFKNNITADNIAKAIATFERTVVSGAAPFDRWVDGDESAISEKAKEGFILFNGKAGCSACHTGWNFTDNKFHDIGLQTEDIGRFELDNTNVLNMHAFKTPGLRNISQRAPYMHNGSIQTLQHVLIHYMSGGMQRESLSPEMKPLALTSEDMNALTEFLKTLQGKDKPMTLPVLPL